MIRYATALVSGQERLFAVRDGQAAEVAALLESGGREPIGEMIAFLDAGPETWSAVESSLASGDGDGVATVAVESLTLAAPLPRPRKILCTFANNSEFELTPIAEQRVWPRPLFFLKAPTAVTAPGHPVVIPEGIGVVQPEGELVVVVGKRVKDLTPADAEDCIFGYTLMNDITAAGLSRQEAMTVGIPGEAGEKEEFVVRPMARYKGLDSFAPLGPFVVPRSELGDPQEVVVEARLNDDVVQRGRVADMRFSVVEVLVEASRWMTLEPGDLVSLGTVSPLPGWPLRKPDLSVYGGVTEVFAEPIGLLRSPIQNGSGR